MLEAVAEKKDENEEQRSKLSLRMRLKWVAVKRVPHEASLLLSITHHHLLPLDAQPVPTPFPQLSVQSAPPPPVPPEPLARLGPGAAGFA